MKLKLEAKSTVSKGTLEALGLHVNGTVVEHDSNPTILRMINKLNT
jgi:ribosomal protein L30/L7E